MLTLWRLGLSLSSSSRCVQRALLSHKSAMVTTLKHHSGILDGLKGLTTLTQDIHITKRRHTLYEVSNRVPLVPPLILSERRLSAPSKFYCLRQCTSKRG